MSQNLGTLVPQSHFTQLGLWYQHYPNFCALPNNDRMKIAQQLVPIAQLGFMRASTDDELINDVNEHVIDSQRILLVGEQNDYRAFLCTELEMWEGYSVYHLHGIILDPRLQGKGLGLSMIKMDIQDPKPEILILTTQNMHMYRLAQRIAYLSTELAIEMAKGKPHIHGQIAGGIYRDGKSLYEDTQKFEPSAIPWIDWRAGDALFVAGFMRKSMYL